MRTLLPLFLLAGTLSVSLVRAQSNLPLVGTILDARTEAPIPYASLSVPGRAGGAVANGEGRFQLALPPGADSVRVQALGYAPLTVVARQPATPALVLRLQVQAYDLHEVQVQGFTPTVLLNQAVRRSTALMASPVVLQTYYREFASYNGQVVKFADALVDYYLQGNPRKPRSPQEQVRVLESRAGELALGQEETKWAIPIPLNVELAGRYYDVLAKNPYLDSANFARYRYAVLETPAGAKDAPYYEVRCTPLTQEPEYVSQATVRIDRRTLTIQRVESDVPAQLQPYLPNWNFLGLKMAFLQARKTVDYQLYQGRLYPSFVRMQFLLDVTKSGVLRHYDFASDLLVRSLADAPAPFTGSERYSGSLYQRGTHYAHPYWQQGSAVPATAAEEKAIKALLQQP